jgi:hypothetical protein
MQDKTTWKKVLIYYADKRKIKQLTIKKAMLEAGFIEECALCYLKDWNAKKLKLSINHVDAIANNCFPYNIRFVCPNCQSQLPKKKRPRKPISMTEQIAREIDKEVFAELDAAYKLANL